MRFSVYIPTAAEGLAYPVPFASADDVVRIAVEAERLGFDGVWGNDHLTTQAYVKAAWPVPPRYYDVLVTLSFVAAATERIELGTALLIPTMRSLPALAKQVATLDQLADGRVRLGVGVGAYREEFEAVQPRVRDARRGAWLDESIAALKLLFTDRVATFRGAYVEFVDVESFPKPCQAHLPVYVGGHGLQAVERAACSADGWLPGWQPLPEMRRRVALLRERLSELGRPADAVEVAPQLSVTLGRTREDAERLYWDSDLVRHRASLAYTGRDLSRQADANLVGTADDICERIDRLAEIGVDHCCALWFIGARVDDMLEQMRWFAEQVIARRGVPS